MDGLDIRTLILTNVVLGAVLGFVLLNYARSNAAFSGIKTLSSGYLYLTVGFFGLMLRDVVPDVLTIVVANAVVMLGIGRMIDGSLRFYQCSPKWFSKLNYASAIFIAVSFWYFSYIEKDINLRIFIISAANVLLLGIALFALYARYQKNPLHRIPWMSITFALLLAFYSFRATWSFYEVELDSFMQAGVVHGLTMLSFQFFMIVVGVSILFASSLRLQKTLMEQASIDSLTKIYNRRALEEAGEKEISRTMRQGVRISAIVVDIDFFKPLNDKYGHQAGDVVLKWFASILKHNIRDHDVLARYGGEEFVVLLPDTDLPSAFVVAEKLRSEIARANVMFGKTEHLKLTASFGVSSMFGESANWFTLIRSADSALYEAKNSGRNCVKSQVPS